MLWGPVTRSRILLDVLLDDLPILFRNNFPVFLRDASKVTKFKLPIVTKEHVVEFQIPVRDWWVLGVEMVEPERDVLDDFQDLCLV